MYVSLIHIPKLFHMCHFGGVLQKNLETFVQDTYDAIAIFLCSHLISRYQMMCHKRAVPALDRYWDTLQAMIWPRCVSSFTHRLLPSLYNLC